MDSEQSTSTTSNLCKVAATLSLDDMNQAAELFPNITNTHLNPLQERPSDDVNGDDTNTEVQAFHNDSTHGSTPFQRNAPHRSTPMNMKRRMTGSIPTATELYLNLKPTVLRHKPPSILTPKDDLESSSDSREIAEESSKNRFYEPLVYENGKMVFQQEKLNKDDELRLIIHELYHDVINVLKHTPKTVVHRRCREDGCYVCRMAENDIQPWLVKYQISPTKPIHCSSKGVYFMGNTPESEHYIGSTLNDGGHRYRQQHRFDREPGFKEGPEKWCFIGFPESNDRSADLILEDALIILTRSVKNVTLNLFDRFGGRKNRVMSFLGENERFKAIYKSRAFFEWLTLSAYEEPCSFETEEIVNRLLPSINVSKDVDSNMEFYAHRLVVRRPFQVSEKVEAVYEKIKKNGSVTNKNIERGQLYGLSNIQTEQTRWMFQKYSATIFAKCHTSCAVCSIFETFIVSEYTQLDLVLMFTHEKHLSLCIMQQKMPGCTYECAGTSRDGIKDVSIHSLVYRKVNITPRPLGVTPSLTKDMSQTCAVVMEMFNAQNDMAAMPGMFSCLSTQADKCGTCGMTGGSSNPALASINLTYNRSINCSMAGVYLMIDKHRSLIEAESTRNPYRVLIKNKYYTDHDELQPLENQLDCLRFGVIE